MILTAVAIEGLQLLNVLVDIMLVCLNIQAFLLFVAKLKYLYELLFLFLCLLIELLIHIVVFAYFLKQNFRVSRSRLGLMIVNRLFTLTTLSAVIINSWLAVVSTVEILVIIMNFAQLHLF